MKRREKEHAELASIVQSSENAIIGMTPEGVITSWNPGAEEIYGYRAEEVLGQSLDPLFPDRDRAEAMRILREVGAGRRVGPFETEGSRKNGTGVQLSVSVSPIRDSARQGDCRLYDRPRHHRAQEGAAGPDRCR